jgi:eukaryotic-like serine/threonine-protein kinase
MLAFPLVRVPRETSARASLVEGSLWDPGELLLPLGTVLGDAYELRALLGQGGMAQVYEAQDLSLGRRVAVKVAREMAYGVLRAEGRALARLRHSSIVSVLHGGEHHGIAYLVMEHIRGASLRVHLDQHQRKGTSLSISVVVDLLVDLAEALAVVHEAGLAHRDLKPENVMLAPKDRVVLMDFGLAEPEFVHPQRVVGGSPSYMAPETISRTGNPGEGHLSDLYSLGIVAYELLLGCTPFGSDDWKTTLRAHQTQRPDDPRDVRPEVPDALAELVLRLLAKRPEDRPAGAQTVAGDLRNVQLVR